MATWMFFFKRYALYSNKDFILSRSNGPKLHGSIGPSNPIWTTQEFEPKKFLTTEPFSQFHHESGSTATIVIR